MPVLFYGDTSDVDHLMKLYDGTALNYTLKMEHNNKGFVQAYHELAQEVNKVASRYCGGDSETAHLLIDISRARKKIQNSQEKVKFFNNELKISSDRLQQF